MCNTMIIIMLDFCLHDWVFVLSTCVITVFFVCDCCDRNMEDYVTWVDTSKIRKHVLEYNEEVRMEGGRDNWS